MEYHIVETAVDLCDIADALVYIGRGGISDVIIDQRKIRLEKRCDDDASVICQLVFVIIDIDNVSVVADIVVIFAGRFDDTAAGLITAVSVDETRTKCLFQCLACHFVDHLTDRDIPLWLVDRKTVFLCVQCNADDTVFAQADQIRLIVVEVFDDVWHAFRRAARLREFAALQNTETLQNGVMLLFFLTLAGFESDHFSEERIVAKCH